MTGLGFFLALKIQNVNNNNLKKIGFNKWYKLQCFFKNKTETIESHLSISFFLALKIQNVNHNNFKIVGYQTKCEYFAVFSYLNSSLVEC